jgi:hypothetical protein
MPTDPVLEILEHHGVKGMRWGVRRKVGSDGRVVGKAKPKSSTDYKTTAPLRKRPSHTLTNMQLKKVNERMQLEAKFHQMNPTRAEKGKKHVDAILKEVAGAAGIIGVAKFVTDPKTRKLVETGYKAVVNKLPRTQVKSLLSEVQKGSFG